LLSSLKDSAGMPNEVVPAPLETGWLPTTPAGDTVFRRFLLNWAAMCAVSARLHGGETLEDVAFSLADSGRASGFSNCATLLQPLAAERGEETLATISGFFAFDDPAKSGFVLLFSLWPTGDLRPFGWRLMGHPPLHLLPAGAAPRPAPPELEVQPVRDRAGLDAWAKVAIEGFPLEELAGSPPRDLMPDGWLDEPRARLWIGAVAGEPVAASAAWVEHGITDVTLVATLPAARRRGYGEALTWHAALADPTLPAMLFSSDEGRPVYERMGFLPLQRVTLWYRPR
jgi:hypothetical protein